MRISEKKSSNALLKVFVALLVMILIALCFIVVKNKLGQVVKPVDIKSEDAVPPSTFREHELILDVKADAYARLRDKSKEALQEGLLFTSKEDLVDADLKIDGKPYACKIRLKGDLLDHLRGDKWSFRIMLKGGQEWKGMNVFSIHNSKSRSHTAEWVMHEVFRQEGIIAPAYDFLTVKLNDKDLGVYAYEHHFENQLLTKNGRELGPILKHNDDAYWDNVQAKVKPFYWVEASHIELFNDSSKDPEFLESYRTAHAMLNDFLMEKKTATEVFDIPLMAKYYALLDISHAWHAQQFTNIRFYFNAITGKLEPIAYDCFGDYLHDVHMDWEAFGEAYNSRVTKEIMYDRGNAYRYLMFRDSNFYKLYMQHLEQYTAPDYLAGLMQKYKADIDARVKLIRTDDAYKDYTMDWDLFYKKAQFTHKKLQPFPNLSLKVYRDNGSKSELALQSFHGFPLEVIGFGTEEVLTDKIAEPILIESYNRRIPVRTYHYKHSKNVDYVYYRTYGLTTIHKTQVVKTDLPSQEIPIASSVISNLSTFPFLQTIGNRIVIPSGRHKLDKPLIIPVDKELEIATGTELVFSGNGSILSYGPVRANGTAQNPIRFYAKAGNRNSLLLSGSDKRSEFSYCHFNGLSGFKYKNITANGAINIYRTEAIFKQCEINNISAQVALSCIHSKVELDHVNFTKCQGSAVVSKYSDLKIPDAKLSDIGRKGISIISGAMEASGIDIKSVLDIGLECKDYAKVYVWSGNISDSYQAFYASEHSNVKLIKLWLSNLDRGIEVRGNDDPVTTVEIKELHAEKVERQYLINEGVSILVNGKRKKAE